MSRPVRALVLTPLESYVIRWCLTHKAIYSPRLCEIPSGGLRFAEDDRVLYLTHLGQVWLRMVLLELRRFMQPTEKAAAKRFDRKVRTFPEHPLELLADSLG